MADQQIQETIAKILAASKNVPGLALTEAQVAYIVGYVAAQKERKSLAVRRIADTDLHISTIGFGCWQLACDGPDSYWGLDYTQEMANELVSLSVDHGITYFDTAEDYQSGASEKQLGQALSVMPPELREKVVISSKISPNNCNAVEEHCNATLARLGIDSIDMYLVHWPIDKNSMAHFAGGHASFGASADVAAIKSVPSIKGAFESLQKLQKAGKIRHIGVSNFGVTQLKEALATGAKIAVNQLCYNMIFRAIEFEILPFCKANGISVVAYSPLMQGLLTGRWNKPDDVPMFRARTRHFDGKRPKSRHGEAGHEALLFKTLEDLKKISAEYNIPLGDLAVAWPLHCPGIASVICGITKKKYIDANIKAAGIKLSEELVSKINEATNELKLAMGGNADLWQGNDKSRIK